MKSFITYFLYLPLALLELILLVSAINLNVYNIPELELYIDDLSKKERFIMEIPDFRENHLLSREIMHDPFKNISNGLLTNSSF